MTPHPFWCWVLPCQKTKRNIEEILDHVEERWLEEEWTRTMPHVINKILQKNLTSIRNPTATRTSHATEGIQWIRMEGLGKANKQISHCTRTVKQKTEKAGRDQGQKHQ